MWCPHIVVLTFKGKKHIEDICFFEVNTKYISSNELKTSEFSRVRSTSENFYVFNSRDEIYLVFTEKKQIFFLFYTHTRETVNLYTTSAPWKEKLTVSVVGVVGSNPRFMLYPNVFEVSFFFLSSLYLKIRECQMMG